jgi:hypothetical protein
MNLYKAIDVWKRVNKTTAIRYRCFESLNSGHFCVQSADFYRIPLDADQVRSLSSQFVELLVEQDPVERSGEYATVAEAIAAHDEEFH